MFCITISDCSLRLDLSVSGRSWHPTLLLLCYTTTKHYYCAIVSFWGSPTYQLSKYLTTMLQLLTDKSRRKLTWQSTEDFINATKTVQIPDDYKLESFYLKSLFTSIPLQRALQCTETAILQSTDHLPLPTEDIMDLLNFCLTSTYFQYNGKHYSYTVQLWGFQFLLL